MALTQPKDRSTLHRSAENPLNGTKILQENDQRATSGHFKHKRTKRLLIYLQY